MRLAMVVLLTCLALPASASDSLRVHHLASLACIDPDTGERFSPLGVARGIDGRLYVVDGDRSRIFSMNDSLGGPAFFTDCPAALDDCRPVDLAADAGWFYVSDRADGLVLVLDSEGRLIGSSEVGVAAGSLGGIGLGEAGQVYAATTVAGSVAIVDVSGQQSAIECPTGGTAEGSCPIDCLVERDSRLLVTDAFSRKVLILGLLGNPLGAIEAFDFRSPFGICSTAGLILVSDSSLGLVAAFDGRGALVTTFGQGVLSAPGFMEADRGRVWVADTARMTIEVFLVEERSRAQH